MSKCLIIMAKPPVFGRTKTRLAKDTGPEKALEYYKLMLDRTIEISKINGVSSVFYFTENHEYLKDFKDQPFEFQNDGDLGFKIKSAFQNQLAKNFERIVMIGTDCPDNTPENILSAFEKLDEYDCVIGPSEDGGYYLLGLKNMHSQLFEGIPWSTEKVFNLTIEKMKQESISYYCLPELNDIDNLKDLRNSTFFRFLKHE